MALTFTTTIRDRVAAVAFGGRAWSALSTAEQNAVAAAGTAAEKMLAAVAARVTGTSASLPDSWEAWLEAAALRRVAAGWDENRLALLARDEDAAREAAISAWVDAAATAVGVDTSDADDAAAYVRAAATRRTPPVYATASEINAAIGYAVSVSGYDAFADIPTRLRNLVADLALQRFLHNAGAGSVGAVEDARREIDRQRAMGDGAETLATETAFATGATYNDAGIRAMIRAAGTSRESPVFFNDAQIDAAIAFAAAANGLGNGDDAIADAPDTLQPLIAHLAVARALATRGVEPESTAQAAQAAIDAERGRLGGTTAWTSQTPFTTGSGYDDEDVRAAIRASLAARNIYPSDQQINLAIAYAASSNGLATGANAIAAAPSKLQPMLGTLALVRMLSVLGLEPASAVDGVQAEIDRIRRSGDGITDLASQTAFAAGGTWTATRAQTYVRSGAASRSVYLSAEQIAAAIQYACGSVGVASGDVSDVPTQAQSLVAQLALVRALATAGAETDGAVEAAQAAAERAVGLGGASAWTGQTAFSTATSFSDDGVRSMIRAGGASRRVFLNDQQVDAGIAYAVSVNGLTPGANAVATAPERLQPMIAHLALLKALTIAGAVDDSDVRHQLEEIERERVRGGGIAAWTAATVTTAGAATDSGVRDAVRAAVVPRGLFLDDGTINAAIAATAAANGLSPGSNVFQQYPSELQPLLTQQVIARVLYNAGVPGAGDMLSEAEDQMHRQRAAFETQMAVGPGLVRDVWDEPGGGGWPIC